MSRDLDPLFSTRTAMTRLRHLDTSSQKESEPVHQLTWFQSHQEQMEVPIASPKLIPEQPSLSFVTTPPPAQKLKRVEENDDANIDFDPMDCHLYLASPIQTLADSIHDVYSEFISLHDIADAYSTLSLRIQDNAVSLLRVDRALVALELVKAQASIVVTALRRDIRRAFVDPVQDTPSRDTSLIFEDSMFSLSEPQRALNEDEIKNARDQSCVCNYSLQFLSDIFHFPALQALFSADQIGDLFDDALSIAFAPALPMCGSQKSTMLCLWMLRTQRLPLHLLMSRKDKLVSGLKNLIQIEFNVESELEGIKIICHLVMEHPAIYISEFSDFFPSILRNLISTRSSILRHETARVLFVTIQGILLGTIASRTCTSISNHMLTFIDAQTSKPKAPSGNSPSHLTRLIHDALHQPDEENKPQWVITILASIIVLSDASFFLHKRCLKFVLPLLSKISVYQHRSVRAFHVPLWKCMVWAFARLRERRSCGVAEVAGERSELSDGTDIEKVYDSAFQLSAQEVKADIGIAIVAVVLGRGGSRERSTDYFTLTSADVTKAISVISKLIGTEDPASSWKTGMLLLARLTSGIGSTSASFPLDNEDVCKSREEWNYHDLLAEEIFDGSVLDAGLSQLQTLGSGIRSIEVRDIRQLSETEIAQHWDALLQLWVTCIRRALVVDAPSISAELIQTWQALLLCPTQLTQGRAHLTTPPEFAQKAASLIIDLIQPGDEPEPTTTRKLSLATRLWTVMKNVFALAWLSTTAESILGPLLTTEFDLADDDLKMVWFALCGDLISVGVPSVVGMLNVEDERTITKDTKMLVWKMMASNWNVLEENIEWQAATDFLLVPFGLWYMSPYEDELWDAVLRSTIRTAAIVSIRPVVIVQHFIERLAVRNLDVSILLTPINSLLSHVDLADIDAFPTPVFIMVNEWLKRNYPPVEEEQLDAVCELIQTLGLFVCSLPAPFIVQLLTTLSDGLCCWIKDESMVLTDSEYNDVVMAFYEETLTILGTLPPDVEILHQLAPLLASAFVRIPSPAIGPMAFKKFWDSAYRGFSAGSRGFPEAIKDCLIAYHVVYGGDPPAGVSIKSLQSSSNSGTVDSPSKHKHPIRGGREWPVQSECDARGPVGHANGKSSGTYPGRPSVIDDLALLSSPSSINRSRTTDVMTQPRTKRRKVTSVQSRIRNANDSNGRSSQTPVTDSLDAVSPHARYRSATFEIEENANSPRSYDIDDYDDWEIGLTSFETRRFKSQFLSDVEVPETEMSDTAETFASSTSTNEDDRHHHIHIIETDKNTSLSKNREYLGNLSSLMTRTTKAAGSAAISASVSHQNHVPAQQSRSPDVTNPNTVNTAPPGEAIMIPFQRTGTIASADVLQQAFDAVRTDGSQLPVADLIQATSMLEELHGLLQDKLKRKLETQE